ncbi:MAG: DNA-directed RNA polymerase subunit K [Nanoarchaeota archaeon]
MARKTESTEEQIEYTKYEKARMIGSRALQLSMGAPFLVKLSQEDLVKIHYDTIEIALLEYDQGVLPITVRRPKTARTN